MDMLFYDDDGEGYDEDDVYQTLLSIGAADCETLFLHSDVKLGNVPKDFKRKEYIKSLANALLRLNVRYLIVPTFTYSFCNNEDYDVLNSRTSMGALNEYLRCLPNRYRTLDPLLSLSVPIELKEKFSKISEHSLGVDSGLDILHNNLENIKFLFMGTSIKESFTYLHYIEKMLNVPYRYDQSFTGYIIDEARNRTEKTQYIHTACRGIKLREGSWFEDYLINNGYMKQKKLGNSFVTCISEQDAYREVKQAIKHNPTYFLAESYDETMISREYTYDLSRGRITHC